jgi:hypothetical protein
MKMLRKLTALAVAGVVAAALMACGDDSGSNPDNPETGVPETSTIDSPPGPGPDGGDGGDGSIVTSSFPAYVKSLIDDKTDDKGAPDQEAVWGAIPDDEKFVYPTTFF